MSRVQTTVFKTNKTQAVRLPRVVELPVRQVRRSAPCDMMIARHVRAEGLILVTNNLKEFQRVPSLRLVSWAARRISMKNVESKDF